MVENSYIFYPLVYKPLCNIRYNKYSKAQCCKIAHNINCTQEILWISLQFHTIGVWNMFILLIECKITWKINNLTKQTHYFHNILRIFIHHSLSLTFIDRRQPVYYSAHHSCIFTETRRHLDRWKLNQLDCILNILSFH